MSATHDDILIDSDAKCVIDYATRKITSVSPKNTLAQYDHNSERVGFTIDRYNDGHDMLQTDRITVIYSNGSTTGSYIVDDAALSEDGTQVVFTWLISNNCTQSAAALRFLINFRCLDSDGNVTYNWSTVICSIFTVAQSINAPPDVVTPDFVDALEEIRKKLQEEFDSDIPDAVDEYLSGHQDELKELIIGDIEKEEEERVEAENSRASAEEERVNAENGRAEAEKARVLAEAERESASASALEQANQALTVANQVNAAHYILDADTDTRYAYAVSVKNGIPYMTLTEITS